MILFFFFFFSCELECVPVARGIFVEWTRGGLDYVHLYVRLAILLLILVSVSYRGSI